ESSHPDQSPGQTAATATGPRRDARIMPGRNSRIPAHLSKLLVLIVAAAVIYYVIRGMTRRGSLPRSPRPAERMVACGQCGINVPQSEALESRGRFYCSEEHRRLAG